MMVNDTLTLSLSAENNIAIESNGIKFQYQGHQLYIVGYFWQLNLQQLIIELEQHKTHALNQAHGHFAGVLITSDKRCIMFNDRFGGRTLYYTKTDTKLVIVSSLAQLLAETKLELCQAGLNEIIDFRWTTGEETLYQGINKLPARHIASIEQHQVTSSCYWQLPPPNYDDLSITDKIIATEQALLSSLQQARQQYDKAVVFLSGGVDSAILAALTKQVFSHVLLVTPVFEGDQNPELATAKAFAKQLELPHILVKIDEHQLLDDFVTLSQHRQECIRHYSSLAMMAMMRAIPDEYQLVVYGDAADTLFGSGAIARLQTHWRWQQQVRYLPKFALQFLKKIIPGRANVLLKLKQQSSSQLIENLANIDYLPQAQLWLLQHFHREPKNKVWHLQKLAEKTKQALNDLRYLAQQFILKVDVAKHFEEAESTAQLFNKHLTGPFLQPQVQQIASTLNNQHYFGNGYLKPVLRELACKYFARELIYQPKHGFPVPFKRWLSEPLKPLVEQAQVAFDLSDLKNLDVAKHYELYWLLINLHQLKPWRKNE